MKAALAMALAGGASFLGATVAAQQESTPGLPATIAVGAADTLRDVAVARYDSQASTIYYNPTLMRRVGPELAAFFSAHEYGHLYHHHTRANAMVADIAQRDSLLQQRELEADCDAAEQLARANRGAVDAAVHFFSRMGSFRFDLEPPTGAQRAANLLACIPTGQPALGAAPPHVAADSALYLALVSSASDSATKAARQ